MTPIAASLTALALLASPAWAGASFTAGAEDAPASAEDHPLTLTLSEPDREDYGQTVQVTVTAGDGFAINRCGGGPLPNTWQCAVDGDQVTFTRGPASVGNDLHFTVDTPAVNGSYPFPVAQDDGTDSSPAASAPAVTVTGGAEPGPEEQEDGGGAEGDAEDGADEDQSAPTDTDDDADDETGDTDGSRSGTASDADGGDPQPDTGTTDADPADDEDADQADDEDRDDGSSGGSTAPRRTEERSSGTTLEIIPGEPGEDDDPSVAEPDVAGGPAIAAPADDVRDEDGTVTAVAGDAPGPQDGADGVPWQQVLGAALLVAGGAVVAARRWDITGRLREAGLTQRVGQAGAGVVDRLRRWRSG